MKAIFTILTLISTLALFLIPAGIAHAEAIYKSVDEQGKVSYSSTPPNDNKQTTKVNIAPPPSQERIKAAQETYQRNKDTADALDENRKKRDEATAKENQLKRENQIQSQRQHQAEKNNQNEYGYPYIPGHIPGRPPIGIGLPVHRPAHRPVPLPAR